MININISKTFLVMDIMNFEFTALVPEKYLKKFVQLGYNIKKPAPGVICAGFFCYFINYAFCLIWIFLELKIMIIPIKTKIRGHQLLISNNWLAPIVVRIAPQMTEA